MRVGTVTIERLRDGRYVAHCPACGAELAGVHPRYVVVDWAIAHTDVCPSRRND